VIAFTLLAFARTSSSRLRAVKGIAATRTQHQIEWVAVVVGLLVTFVNAWEIATYVASL
jgi:hypothetical protein